MIRNLKSVGLAMAAVLVFAALGVSSASADPTKAHFHSEQAHTILDAVGEGHHTFVTPAGTVTCKKVTADGTTEVATPTEITATDITYTECTTKTILGTINVTVDFKGCDYLFTASGEVHIICPTGTGPITVAGPGCTITVGAQTVKTATYTALGAGTTRDITIHANMSNISGSASGFSCDKTGAFTTGTYTGAVTVTGTNTVKEHVGIWWTTLGV